VLHTDECLLPRRRAAWSAWNYQRDAVSGSTSQNVCLHYLINQLQPLPWQQSMIVSLNPLHAPRPETMLRRITYAHPMFDNATIAAQARLADLQGRSHVWFCGAWTGYGFHEDGLKSGQQVAGRILAGRACARVVDVETGAAVEPLREAA